MSEQHSLKPKFSAKVRIFAGLSLAAATVFSIVYWQSDGSEIRELPAVDPAHLVAAERDVEAYQAQALAAVNSVSALPNESTSDVPSTGALTTAEGGRWGPVIQWPHIAASLANLPDGRVMSWSGSERTSWPTPEQTYSAVWDPRDDSFDEIFMQGHNMFSAAATMSADGRVFVNGGRNNAQSKWTSVFDWRENDWIPIQDMASGGRWYPGAVALSDGDVYTAIGSSSRPWQGERWNEDNGWTVQFGVDWNSLSSGGGNEREWWPFLIQAPNGNLLHAGPTKGFNWIDPNGDGSSTPAGDGDDRFYHKHSGFVVYDEGKALFAGGWKSFTDRASTNEAFIVDFNEATPRVTPIESMTYARKYQNAVVLPNGEVAVFGGNTSGQKFSDAGSIYAVEIWNPESGQWRIAADSSVPRNYHSTALLLTDGQVVSAGSGYDAGAFNHQDGQVWAPPYLFDDNGDEAQRPAITSASELMFTGESFDLKTDAPVAKFSMIKMSATTHGYNTDQRFLWVDSTDLGGNSYRLNAHPNVNVLTPGYWMLFALDANGTPSKSHVVRVAAATDAPVDGVSVGLIDTVSVTQVDESSWLSLAFEDVLLRPPVVLAGPVGAADEKPTTARIKNVSAEGFELQLDNWDYLSGEHAEESVSVLALQPGAVDMGALDAEAGITLVDHQWVQVNFDSQMGEVPMVFATVNSATGQEAVVARVRNVTSTSFEVRLQEQEDSDNVHVRESVAWLAVTPGVGSYDGKLVAVGSTQLDDAWAQINFGIPLESADVFASVQSFINEEPLNVRHRSANASGVELKISEEKSLDDETSAPTETVAWMAVGEYKETVITTVVKSPSESGASASFTVASTGGGVQYLWRFGDGTTLTTSETTVSHTYTEPGRYLVRVSVVGATGGSASKTFEQLVYEEVTEGTPAHSSTIAKARDLVWNVNPDNNSVTAVNESGVQYRIPVGEAPWALAASPDGTRLWVANKKSATLDVINTSIGGVITSYEMPVGSQPHGLVFSPDGAFVYVALEAGGELLKLSSQNGSIAARTDVGARPRHVSITGDGQTILVSRFITPPLPGESGASPDVGNTGNWNGGEVLVVDAAALTIEKTIELRHSNRGRSENTGPGLPNYLGAAVISPSGRSAWIPSKQDNVLGGSLRSSAMTFDQAVRAISSRVEMGTLDEDFSTRIDHDNASVANYAAFDPKGLFLFTSLEGNRQVAVSDVQGSIELMRINVGFAPQGLVVSDDSRTLYVHNFMERTISEIDISSITQEGNLSASLLSTHELITDEALSAEVLLGKKLFHDAADDRLAALDYMSCASCHNDADHDGRVWDFTQLDEGVRNTTSLRGKGNPEHGLFHWTGNFNEVQDFEGQIRAFGAGRGLMSDSDFEQTKAPLGLNKQGLSADLDALAAYVESLKTVPTNPNGAVEDSASATRGKIAFVANCVSCHSTAFMTDSETGALHDIGTATAASGSRIGESITGFDTPSLLGAWETAPYLHDGSAQTLRDAINAHTNVTLNNTQVTDIENYLLRLPAVAEDPDTDQLLSNGVVVSGDISRNAWDWYVFDAPANNTEVSFALKGLSDDGDLYVRAGERPSGHVSESGAEYDGSSTAGGTAGERVTLANTGATRWYIGVHGYRATPYTIEAEGIAAAPQEERLVDKGTIADGVAEISDIKLKQWHFYTIETDGNQDELIVELSGMSADGDLYVRENARPSGHVGEDGIYDCSSTNGSQRGETCELNVQGSSSIWHIGVYGYQATPYTLSVSLTQVGGPVITDPVTTIAFDAPTNSIVEQGAWQYFKVETPATATQITVDLTGLDEDGDLYVRAGDIPSGHFENGGNFDCQSIRGGTSDEQCSLVNSGETVWNIGVYGYRGTNFTLNVSYSEPETPVGNQLTLDVLSSGEVGLDEWQFYTFESSADQLQLSFKLAGLEADADLYVRAGERPTGHINNNGTYDCSSTFGRTLDENCVVENDGVTIWHIGVHGYRASVFEVLVNASATRAWTNFKGDKGKGEDTSKDEVNQPNPDLPDLNEGSGKGEELGIGSGAVGLFGLIYLLILGLRQRRYSMTC